jgi:hypothetical protein
VPFLILLPYIDGWYFTFTEGGNDSKLQESTIKTSRVSSHNILSYLIANIKLVHYGTSIHVYLKHHVVNEMLTAIAAIG